MENVYILNDKTHIDHEKVKQWAIDIDEKTEREIETVDDKQGERKRGTERIE